MIDTVARIRDQQRMWAAKHGINFDKNGYTLILEDNLFIPLTLQTKAEFAAGKGKELGDDKEPGKMQALHSSAALVVNFFEYWRHTGKTHDLAKAMGIGKNITAMRFEQTFPTGLGGTAPHLDVVLSSEGTMPIAIEAKFTETYHHHLKRPLNGKYIEQPSALADLPGCRKLVEEIFNERQSRTSFEYLDAPQLLKHIIGLTTKYGRNKFKLIYLWYDISSVEADTHKDELQEFMKLIADDAQFENYTYQTIFEKIWAHPDVDRDYLAYLIERYFEDTK